jgi:hypothetical protein
MDAESYLRRYLRPVPGGAIAWRQSVFADPEPFSARELIDLAVDIAWETLAPAGTTKSPSLEIRRSGSYLVFSLSAETAGKTPRKAA